MSSHKVGLDFGTANSVVSYFENGTLHLFEYEFKNGQKHIPSLIVYDGDGIVIGDAARSKIIRDPNVEGYGRFQKQLLFHTSKYLNSDQEQRARITVTADFLRELLFSKEVQSSSFSQQKGNIKNLVISIPETYYRDIANQEKVCLNRLIMNELGIGANNFQLISESVAAATYWIWEKQRQNLETHGNLLVCNMGSSSFNLSLCSISTTEKVKVLYSDNYGDAGFDFDRQCVQLAYTEKHGHFLAEESREFIRLLKDFELKKVNSHQESTSRLITYLKMPEAMAEYNLYCFGGGYAVKCQHISEAFAPIQKGIQEVIQHLYIWMQSHQQSFDFLFIIGDLCQFILTQNTILQALDIQESDPRFDPSFNNAYSSFAISHGACLIANSLIDPVERCVYTLGIVAENLNANAERERQLIPIIQGGTDLDDLLETQFLDQPLLTAFTGNFSTITVWVDAHLQGDIFREVKLDAIKLPNYSCRNHWRVGMRVNHSHIFYLVIEDCKNKQRLEYELGILSNIVAQL
ncbi:Hsp70 family protein [Calothrix sp. PCC 6303]|jgi:molecular chaperone DnaK|uniref:Hsp70 family protein n=1 Tax=Calothrix sp. PCC 6303 TaxID=1170562 RepID=UPI0002A04F51|nr:Hsp70 family protein [Calothrix sp. PCC 6303]AFZ04572.1 molecular chaperone [Calothrix sp. PCC 6303]